MFETGFTYGGDKFTLTDDLLLVNLTVYTNVQKAINMKQQNKYIFKTMGNRVYQQVATKNSKEKVQMKFQNLYEEFVSSKS